jgi:hypothetical protein
LRILQRENYFDFPLDLGWPSQWHIGQNSMGGRLCLGIPLLCFLCNNSPQVLNVQLIGSLKWLLHARRYCNCIHNRSFRPWSRFRRQAIHKRLRTRHFLYRTSSYTSRLKKIQSKNQKFVFIPPISRPHAVSGYLPVSKLSQMSARAEVFPPQQELSSNIRILQQSPRFSRVPFSPIPG